MELLTGDNSSGEGQTLSYSSHIHQSSVPHPPSVYHLMSFSTHSTGPSARTVQGFYHHEPTRCSAKKELRSWTSWSGTKKHAMRAAEISLPSQRKVFYTAGCVLDEKNDEIFTAVKNRTSTEHWISPKVDEEMILKESVPKLGFSFKWAESCLSFSPCTFGLHLSTKRQRKVISEDNRRLLYRTLGQTEFYWKQQQVYLPDKPKPQ